MNVGVPIILLVILAVLAIFFVGGFILAVTLIRSQNQAARTFGWILLAAGVLMPILFLGAITFTWQVTPHPATRAQHGPSVRTHTTTVQVPPVVVQSPLMKTTVELPPKKTTTTVQLPPVTTSIRVPARIDPPKAPDTIVVPRFTSPAIDSSAWLPQVEQEFEANVYPSALSAARSLGIRAAGSISDWADSVIVVQGTFPTRPPDALQPAVLVDEVAKQMRAKLPSANIVSAQPKDSEDALVLLDLKLSRWTEGNSSEDSGTLELKIATTDSTKIHTATFVQKTWVESLSEFTSKRTGDNQWIVAKSFRLAESPEQARQLAVEAAQQMFASADARDALSDAIRSGELVADRFTQRLSRSYGDVWREAILIDVTPSRIATIMQRADDAEARRLSTVRGRLVGFLVIAVFATLIYALLNAVTRGYYRSPVGIVVGTLVVVVVIAAVVV